ncbi:MAG: protease modulator HflK [bacterium]|nr:protease modulator HflK [bacterium]
MDAEPSRSVRAIRAVRDGIHRRGRELAGAVLALGLLSWLAAGIYTVQNGESAALLRFGRLVDDAIGPGLRFALPGIHQVHKARTGDVFRLEIEGDLMPELALVTGDENLIEATLVIQYRISDLGDFLFSTEDPQALLEQVVRAALVEAFAVTPVDEVLTSAKASIQLTVRRQAQERIENVYHGGVTLVAINLQSVEPPPEADGAFRAVSDARAEAAQAINQAQGEKDRALRLARGEAGQIRSAAEATADRRRQEARGAAERFESLLRQRRESPEQAWTELYNTTVQQVLPRARLIFLAPGENPEIDVHLIERSDRERALPPPISGDG